MILAKPLAALAALSLAAAPAAASSVPPAAAPAQEQVQGSALGRGDAAYVILPLLILIALLIAMLRSDDAETPHSP